MNLCSRPDPAQVLSDQTLRRLVCELGDQAALDRFLEMFLELLPSRLAEVGEVVRHGQRRPSDVVTNLAAIAEMVGGERLAAHLCRLPWEGAPRWAISGQERFVRDAHVEAIRLRRALLYYLDQRGDAGCCR